MTDEEIGNIYLFLQFPKVQQWQMVTRHTDDFREYVIITEKQEQEPNLKEPVLEPEPLKY